GLRERAAAFYTRAAFQALEGNDFVAAKLRADRAIQAGATGIDHGRMRLVLAEASRWSGEHDAAREHARAAMADLRSPSPPAPHDDWWVAAAEAIEAAMTLGHVEEAKGMAHHLVEVAATAPMTAARAIA